MSQIQQQGRSKTVDNESNEEVEATWNARGLIDKEEEFDELRKEQHIQIVILAKVRKRLQGTTDTRRSSEINSAVKQSIGAETGVILWIHKTQTEMTEYYKFWEDWVIEAIFKKNRGYLIIFGLYVREEERKKETE